MKDLEIDLLFKRAAMTFMKLIIEGGFIGAIFLKTPDQPASLLLVCHCHCQAPHCSLLPPQELLQSSSLAITYMSMNSHLGTPNAMYQFPLAVPCKTRRLVPPAVSGPLEAAWD